MKNYYQKLSALITAGVLTCLAAVPVFAEYDDYSLPDGAEITADSETAADDFVLSDGGANYSADGYTISGDLEISDNLYASVSLPSISSSRYISTYTYNSSGKVYAYTDKNLNTKTGGYISCGSDECRIISVANGSNGCAIQVSYPVSSGRKTAWFKCSDFTYRNLYSEKAKETVSASKQVTTYKWKNSSSTYGYVSKGDNIYVLRGSLSSDEWIQIIYPVSGGYKMGWIKGSDYRSTSSSGSSSSSSSKSSSLAAIAADEVGYQGTTSNGYWHGDYTKYGKWFGNNGVSWCAIFVSWCVNQAGVSTNLVPKTAACETMRKNSSAFKNWSSSALNNINKNDVIFFSGSNGGESHHVGIVVSVSGSKITLIEGNTSSDIVKQNTYTVENSSTGKIKGGSGSWAYFRGYIPVE